MECMVCGDEYILDPRHPRTRFQRLCRPCALFARNKCRHEARWRRYDWRQEAYDLFVDTWHREPRLGDYSFLHPSRRRAARRRIAVWQSAVYLQDREVAARLGVCKPWAAKLRRRVRPGIKPVDRYLAWGMEA